MMALLKYHTHTLFDAKTKILVFILLLINTVTIIYYANPWNPSIESIVHSDFTRLTYHLDVMFFLEISMILFIIVLASNTAFFPNRLIPLIIRTNRITAIFTQFIVYLMVALSYPFILMHLSYIVLKQTPFYGLNHYQTLMPNIMVMALYYSILIYILASLFKNYYALIIFFVLFFISTMLIEPNQSIESVKLLSILYQTLLPTLSLINNRFNMLYTPILYLGFGLCGILYILRNFKLVDL